VPPKNSKASSKFAYTSLNSKIVLSPTAHSVNPLISLLAPISSPPCCTEVYRTIPVESCGSRPPQVASLVLKPGSASPSTKPVPWPNGVP
jgi:hypothetical protein